MKTLLKYLLGIPLTLYVIFCGIVFFFQENLVFYARGSVFIPPKEIEEVYFETEDGRELHGWYYEKNPSYKTVIFSHGNGSNLDEGMMPTYQKLKTLNLNFLYYTYRGFGKTEGNIPRNQKEFYLDAEAALTFMTDQKKIPETNIIVWGRSIGCAAALKIAAERDIAGVILEAPFYSANEIGKNVYWFLRISLLSMFELPNYKYIQDIQSPIIILHSPSDAVVPFSQGQKLFEITPEPKTFVEISGDHVNGISDPKYISEVRKFLRGL